LRFLKLTRATDSPGQQVNDLPSTIDQHTFSKAIGADVQYVLRIIDALSLRLVLDHAQAFFAGSSAIVSQIEEPLQSAADRSRIADHGFTVRRTAALNRDKAVELFTRPIDGDVPQHITAGAGPAGRLETLAIVDH